MLMCLYSQKKVVEDTFEWCKFAFFRFIRTKQTVLNLHIPPPIMSVNCLWLSKTLLEEPLRAPWCSQVQTSLCSDMIKVTLGIWNRTVRVSRLPGLRYRLLLKPWLKSTKLGFAQIKESHGVRKFGEVCAVFHLSSSGFIHLISHILQTLILSDRIRLNIWPLLSPFFILHLLWMMVIMPVRQLCAWIIKGPMLC